MADKKALNEARVKAQANFDKAREELRAANKAYVEADRLEQAKNVLAAAGVGGNAQVNVPLPTVGVKPAG